MTLSSRHRIRNSSPGGLRPSTLPLGHGGSPQYWLSHVDGEETFFVYFKPPRPGTEPLTLAWKAAVLITTLGPPPHDITAIRHQHSAPLINTRWISAHRSSTLTGSQRTARQHSLDLSAPLTNTHWISAHRSSTLTGSQRTAHQHSLDLRAPLVNTHGSQRTAHQHSLDLSAPLVNTRWISAHRSSTLGGSQRTAHQHSLDLSAPLVNTHWISAHRSSTLAGSQRTARQHSLDLSAPLTNTR